MPNDSTPNVDACSIVTMQATDGILEATDDSGKYILSLDGKNIGDDDCKNWYYVHNDIGVDITLW